MYMLGGNNILCKPCADDAGLTLSGLSVKWVDPVKNPRFTEKFGGCVVCGTTVSDVVRLKYLVVAE